jgi:hypothetical protein
LWKSYGNIHDVFFSLQKVAKSSTNTRTYIFILIWSYIGKYCFSTVLKIVVEYFSYIPWKPNKIKRTWGEKNSQNFFWDIYKRKIVLFLQYYLDNNSKYFQYLHSQRQKDLLISFNFKEEYTIIDSAITDKLSQKCILIVISINYIPGTNACMIAFQSNQIPNVLL